MTSQAILAEVERRAETTDRRDEREVRAATIKACSNVLDSPHLPGDWWAEQIILEAARILRETPR